MSEDDYKLMSSFHFEGAKVVVLPPLGYKLINGRDIPFNTAVLEVYLPEGHNNTPASTLVEVEAWGKVAQGLSTTIVGDVVNVHGLVIGKPYVNKQGEQKYLTILRLRGVEVARRAPVRKTANDFGF